MIYFLSSEVKWSDYNAWVKLFSTLESLILNAYILILSMISLFSDQWLEEDPDLCSVWQEMWMLSLSSRYPGWQLEFCNVAYLF